MAVLTRHSVLGFLCGVVTLLLLEAGAGYYMLNLTTDRTGTTQASPGNPPLPAAITLADLPGSFTDLDGNPQSYRDLQGKVVVINRWATWCPPCRMEMPSLDSLWKIFRDDRQVAIYCISDEAPEDVRAHPVTRDLSMPLYVFGQEIPDGLQTRGVPTTFIFDRSGRLVFTHTGMARWDAENMVAYIQTLRGEGPGRRE